jgi:hypothetical protein
VKRIALLIGCLFLLACSSEGDGGGDGGKGGQSGSQAGSGTGGDNCAALERRYGQAMLLRARMCNASLTVVQCAQEVSSKLACGCPTFVNDKTELEMIRSEWLQSSCSLNIICPAIACPEPPKVVCLPIDSGDFCTNSTAAR